MAEKYPGRRLHVRAIVRDGRTLFLGSQSLRRLELDKRREIGVIADEKKGVLEVVRAFEADWAQTPTGKASAETEAAEKTEPKELKEEVEISA